MVRIMDLQHVRDHLQHAYNELLCSIWDCKRMDHLSFIVNQIYALNDVYVVAVYQWHGTYYKRLLLHQLKNSTYATPEKMTIEEQKLYERTNEKGYPIQIKEDYLLLITTRKPMQASIRSFIRSEVINMLDLMQGQMNERTQYQFLYHLTVTLFVQKQKSTIVEIILHAFKHFYPTNKIQLLLSQDTEIDVDYPIEPIEYNDKQSVSLSTKAFISGEVQVEKQLETVSSIFLPLTGNQGVYGVIQLFGKGGHNFSNQDILFVTNVAKTAGKAIENASLMEHNKRLISELKLINDVTHHLNSNLDLKDIAEYIRDTILEICEAQEIGFIFYTETGEMTILQASTDYFHGSDSFATFLMEQEMRATFHGNYNAFPDLPYRSLICIPLQQGVKVYGMVVLMHSSSYFFSFEMFKFMQSLIQHCSLAFFNTILKEELQKAVITDDLTKLYSRNYLEGKISQQRQIARNGSLILFDIDDFKKVNDTYGHHIGDNVLKQVAKIIRQFSNHHAIPARWGGEELAIYTPDKEINEAVVLAEEICNYVENNTDPPVTLSCGVSTWKNNCNDSISELFVRADRALYKAKHRGKNSVVRG